MVFKVNKRLGAAMTAYGGYEVQEAIKSFFQLGGRMAGG